MSVEIAAQNITRLQREVDELRRINTVIERNRIDKDIKIAALHEDVAKLEWLMEKTGWDRYRIWKQMIKEENQ